ncbi:MAG: hypothetical protein QXU18_00335 [Thermoplasmatales archaeon]
MGDINKLKPEPVFTGNGEINKHRCPPGYHLVLDYFCNHAHKSSMALEINGVYVGEYCRKQ